MVVASAECASDLRLLLGLADVLTYVCVKIKTVAWVKAVIITIFQAYFSFKIYQFEKEK